MLIFIFLSISIPSEHIEISLCICVCASPWIKAKEKVDFFYTNIDLTSGSNIKLCKIDIRGHIRLVEFTDDKNMPFLTKRREGEALV